MKKMIWFTVILLVCSTISEAQTKNTKPSASKKKLKTELCFGEYRAEQVPGYVIVTASGSHNTGGFKTFFVQGKINVFPPEFALWHVAPTGDVEQAITSFEIHVGFGAKGKVDAVTIHDAKGKHSVPVTQTPD